MTNSQLPVVVLARGGSVGIPNKNLMPFCGKPLLQWTLEYALKSKATHSVWVSTDHEPIARLAKDVGVEVINRPEHLSTSTSSSESGWIHAFDEMKERGIKSEVFAALQATSPLRRPLDLDQAFEHFLYSQLDSLFSGSVFDDLTLWEFSKEYGLHPSNHDPKKRLTRQENPLPIVENGSIYIMKNHLLKSSNSRFSGKVGYSENLSWQVFEIDSSESLEVCEFLMQKFIIEPVMN